MDLFSAITKRRSVRAYMDKPVEFDKITAIIEAGTWAPSAGNLQNWQFIIITDKEKIEKISNHCPNQNFVFQAPVLIAVLSDNDRMNRYYGAFGKFWGAQGVAACIQNMLLCATALKLGTCWIGAYDAEAISDMLDIPGKSKLQALITLGYGDGGITEPTRLPIEGGTFFNTFGNKHTNVHLYMGQYSEEIKKHKTAAQGAITRMGRDYGDILKAFFSRVHQGSKEAIANFKDMKQAKKDAKFDEKIKKLNK